MRWIITCFFLVVVCLYSIGQTKFDRNWVFGNGAGIDFNNLQVPQTFTAELNSHELTACISDSNGNLLYYLSIFGSNGVLKDDKHKDIISPDKIYANGSCTDCAVFIPMPHNNYFLFHVGNNQNLGTKSLYLTKITRINVDSSLIYSKNEVIFSRRVSEKVAFAKHANDADWWLILHEVPQNNFALCTNTFYKFLITPDSIIGPIQQNVGAKTCDQFAIVGEMSFSNNGNYLALANEVEQWVELMSFDRCSGELYNPVTVDTGGSLYPYGLEFSKNERFLYVTSISAGSTIRDIDDELYQYDLLNNYSKATIGTNSDSLLSFAQLELGTDGKIYMSSAYGIVHPNNYSNQYNENLSVINQPDSLGALCDFQPFSFPLADSAKSIYSLPNMPNYNLGPLSIYEADAGADTLVFCTDTAQKGLILGTDSVSGVLYSWSPNIGLDNDSIAQPFLDPDVSRWYYVNLTDTSIQYSCQSRTDSVYIEVRQCNTSTLTPNYSSYNYVLHPNLLSGQLFTTLVLGSGETGRVEIYSVAGAMIDEFTVGEGMNTLELANPKYSNGVYLYQVWINGALKHRDKLVVISR